MKEFSHNSLPKIIRVCDLYPKVPKLTFDNGGIEWISNKYDVIDCRNEQEVFDVLMRYKDDVEAIVTYSKADWKDVFPDLARLPNWYLGRWFHYNDYKDHGTDVYYIMMRKFLNTLDRYGRPLFSFTTPLYNTEERFLTECYTSLTSQKVDDWEWVLLDDSPQPLEHARRLAETDMRVRYFRINPTGGNIGKAKWYANCMSEGKWLMELDHDDTLLPWCLEMLKSAIDEHPECGFIYSDTLQIDDRGDVMAVPFGESYAMGFAHASKYTTPDGCHTIEPVQAAPINPATIRHIVGVPNHFRCWRRDVYFGIGGHNTVMRICDDYELIVRTFLATEMCHIKYPCYAQRYTPGENSQDGDGGTNRADIQRRVEVVANLYNQAIHDRMNLLSGGLEVDWVPELAWQTREMYTPENCDWFVNKTWVPEILNNEDFY